MKAIAMIIRQTGNSNFNFSTHAVGGGEWAIEMSHPDHSSVVEFIGSNGTNSPADDLWEEARAAINAAIAFNTAMFGGGFTAK